VLHPWVLKNHKEAMWLENWGSKNTFRWPTPQALKECETLKQQVGRGALLPQLGSVTSLVDEFCW